MFLIALRLAPYAVILALAALAFFYRGNAIEAEAAQAVLRRDLAVVEAVNASNIDVIDKITKQRLINEELALDLSNKVYEATQAAAEVTEARTGVELVNEDVRAYLSSPIPDDLKRLYNR